MQTTSSSSSSTTTATSSTVTTGPALPKARFSWIFPADKFISTPSNRDGIPAEEELSSRQQAAVFIYELGTYLKVPHYCINTAVVYMHRFYMINSFKRFTRQRVCASSLFLACKVEEFPRTLRDVIENTGKVLRRKKAEEFTPEIIAQYTDDIVLHENILLSTLGFSLMVDHPHPIIIKTIQALGSQIQSLPEKTPRELAQTAYYLATKSILLTSFCVKYPPDLIACFCIHLAAAWLKIEIPSPPTSSQGPTTNESDTTVTESTPNKRWFHFVNESFTEKQLGELADEFLAIYAKCPEKIKKKLVYQNERPQSTSNEGASNSQQQHHSSASAGLIRPIDVADSVVPQGAAHVKNEPRPNQPPLPPSRLVQPPPPASSQMFSNDIKREVTASLPYPPSNRPPMPSHHNSSSSTSSSSSLSRHPPYPHPPPSSSHYQSHHPPHNNNYNPHSRYPPQPARSGPLPPNRSSQQPPPLPPPPNRSSQQPPLPPPPHAGDRRHPQPPPHGYDHPPQPPLPPPSSSSASNRPPYGSQHQPQHGNHYPNVPMPGDSYHQQAPYNRSRPPSLMQSGDKRSYDSSYDPNNPNKRPRPS